MLHAHIVDRSELKQSFGLNLVLAMAFRGCLPLTPTNSRKCRTSERERLANREHHRPDDHAASDPGSLAVVEATARAQEEIPEQRAPSARARGEAAPREGRLAPARCSIFYKRNSTRRRRR